MAAGQDTCCHCFGRSASVDPLDRRNFLKRRMTTRRSLVGSDMPTSDYAWGLTPEQEPRRTCLWLIENETFDRFVLLVILANCVLMALDVPTGVSPSLGIFIAEANIFFLGFYTVELLIRVVAVGLHSRPGGFFTDSFAVFEGLIVLVSWLAQLIPGEAGARSIARSFRALRVLLVLNDIPGMQQLVKAALQVLPSVSNVSGLCFGILLIMGVTGDGTLDGAIDGPRWRLMIGLHDGLLLRPSASSAPPARLLLTSRSPPRTTSSRRPILPRRLPLPLCRRRPRHVRACARPRAKGTRRARAGAARAAGPQQRWRRGRRRCGGRWR